jgi:hypothetical protein
MLISFHFQLKATGGLGPGAHKVITSIVQASQDRQSYVPAIMNV